LYRQLFRLASHIIEKRADFIAKARRIIIPLEVELNEFATALLATQSDFFVTLGHDFLHGANSYPI
jgi:hypothetical protein